MLTITFCDSDLIYYDEFTKVFNPRKKTRRMLLNSKTSAIFLRFLSLIAEKLPAKLFKKITYMHQRCKFCSRCKGNAIHRSRFVL